MALKSRLALTSFSINKPMLSIHWIFDPEYYLDQASPDYYLSGGEPPGNWYSPLGNPPSPDFRGVVSPEALRAAFAGRNVDGHALIQLDLPQGKKHQAAWDLTFSAPKAFSVLWSASNRRMRRALQSVHQRAVKKALKYLQKVAAYTRTGKNGVNFETALLLFALFDHCTSRELDPQIHTHALLINICRGLDSKTRTIWSKSIYEHKMAAGAVYQAALAEGVKRLGFIVTHSENGFGILGVPEELCREQSKRRSAIERVLGSKGLNSAKASAIATLATRKAKQIPPREELFERWRQTNEAHGLTEKAAQKLLQQDPSKSRNRQTTTAAAESISLHLQSFVQGAVKTILQSESHFSERELYRQALRDTITHGFDPDDIYEAVKLEIATNLVSLGRRDGYVRYTTKETLRREQELLGTIAKLAENNHHVCPSSDVERLIEKRLPLSRDMSVAELARNGEQRLAVKHLTTRDGACQVLSGMAGTGKSYTLGLCREAWEANRLRVIGVCQAGAAARRLEEGSGIKSDTLDLLLTKLRHASVQTNLRDGTKAFFATSVKAESSPTLLLDSNTVVNLDEAGQAGTKKLAELVGYVHAAGAKLVLVGDRDQLQPIEAGGPMKAIEEKVGRAELQVITRQKEIDTDPQPTFQRDAVRHFAKGESVEGLSLLVERGKVSVSEDRGEAKVAMARDWSVTGAPRPEEHLLLCASNEDRKDLNDLCQLARMQQGFLGAPHVKVGEETLHINERILFRERSRELGVENGDFGTLTKITYADNCPQVVVKLDRGETVTVPLDEYRHIERGYCVTVYSSQGATVPRTSVLVGGAGESLHQSYVEASRHTDECKLYTSKWEAGQILEDLAIQMATPRRKDLALDVLREKEFEPQISLNSYYDPPRVNPEKERLQLEKLEGLRGRLLPESIEVKAPTKSKEEIQALLQKLREKSLAPAGETLSADGPLPRPESPAVANLAAKNHDLSFDALLKRSEAREEIASLLKTLQEPVTPKKEPEVKPVEADDIQPKQLIRLEIRR